MQILVQVRYRNNREGLVDDVTLNELILSGKIKQFYRPSESRWVDVDHDSVRVKSNGYKGPERREANRTAKKEEPSSLISRLLRRKKVKEKPLSAKEWFEQGFYIMHTSSDYQEAIRAFASSIQLDPTNARTYLNRGMSYERINNMQQAIADYSTAIELVPKDAKAYYIRGVLFWRLGKDVEALSDIEISAELGYR
jgi:tetratricopeptide (TPR) repeat protein